MNFVVRQKVVIFDKAHSNYEIATVTKIGDSYVYVSSGLKEYRFCLNRKDSSPFLVLDQKTYHGYLELYPSMETFLSHIQGDDKLKSLYKNIMGGTIMELKVGQEVAILSTLNRHKEIKPGVVTRIGRKYLYAKYDTWEIRFDKKEYNCCYLRSNENGYIGHFELFPSVQAFHDFEEAKMLRLEILNIIERRDMISLSDLKKIREILQ